MHRTADLFSIRSQFCVGNGDNDNLLGSHPRRHHNPLCQGNRNSCDAHDDKMWSESRFMSVQLGCIQDKTLACKYV